MIFSFIGQLLSRLLWGQHHPGDNKWPFLPLRLRPDAIWPLPGHPRSEGQPQLYLWESGWHWLSENYSEETQSGNISWDIFIGLHGCFELLCVYVLLWDYSHHAMSHWQKCFMRKWCWDNFTWITVYFNTLPCGTPHSLFYQAFPSGVSEEKVQVLGSVSRAASLDDIAKWSITKIDTLAALMKANDGPWEAAQVQCRRILKTTKCQKDNHSFCSLKVFSLMSFRAKLLSPCIWILLGTPWAALNSTVLTPTCAH